jgi:tRNA pseudouridine55 synthase
MSKSGSLFLHKPKDITSFQALSEIKKELGTNKVGHAGTLDKFASGLLIVLTGKMTKCVPLITNMDKSYHAVFRFGAQTDTLDPEGTIIKEGPLPNMAKVEEKLKTFLEIREQHPPRYSAVHVKGKRSSKIARAGGDFVPSTKRIRINAIELLDWDPPDATLNISCSKGVYVRSIARDVGAKCGTAAFCIDLVRTRIGPFTLKDAHNHIVKPFDFFHKIPDVSFLTVKPEYVQYLYYGKPLLEQYFTNPIFKDGLYAVTDVHSHFVALLEKTKGDLQYKFVGEKN